MPETESREQLVRRLVSALHELGGGGSQTDLAAVAELSRSTVADTAQDLESHDLVTVETRRTGSTGRPPKHVELRPDAGVAVAVDFGHGHVRVGTATLTGDWLGDGLLD